MLLTKDRIATHSSKIPYVPFLFMDLGKKYQSLLNVILSNYNKPISSQMNTLPFLIHYLCFRAFPLTDKNSVTPYVLAEHSHKLARFNCMHCPSQDSLNLSQLESQADKHWPTESFERALKTELKARTVCKLMLCYSL